MNSEFTNSVILPENLPALEPASFNPVDRKYLKIIYLQHLMVAVMMIFWGVVFYIIPKDEIVEIGYWVMVGLFVVIISYSLIISYLSFPRRGYLIRDRDIAYQRGLIRYKLTSIPFNRIQHVVLNQGVVAKHFHLASIKIFTAGSSADDLNIPGLPFETASQIREFLTGKISSDDQD